MRRIGWRVCGSCLLAVSLLAAACGGDSEELAELKGQVAALEEKLEQATRTTATTQAPATTTTNPPPALVSISGFAYSGATEASVGQTIRFTNMDGTAHTASAAGNTFDTGTLSGGQSADVVIDQPGTYTYFCWFHGGMTGTITVTE